MRISRLSIRGFRGISQADLRFGDHCVLVGPNNVGKTTVIEALALLFGRDRLVRDLTEHDFFGSAPTEQSRITIVATLTGFDSDVGDPFDDSSAPRLVRGKALQELGFFLISATRTWDRWISFSSDLFRKVIAATGEVPAKAVRQERDRVRNPLDRLEKAEGIA